MSLRVNAIFLFALCIVSVLPHAHCATPFPSPSLSPTPSPMTKDFVVHNREEEIKEIGEIQDDLRNSLKSVGGCHANVCFAIDGGGALSPEEFKSQKNFVLDVVSVIAVDQPVSLAAVQYASRRLSIKRLTRNVTGFILAVNATEQLGGMSKTVAGITFCDRQLRRWYMPNKIVLLGHGRSDIGRNAARTAHRFRDSRGDLSVVAAGDSDKDALLSIVGGEKDQVYNVRSFLDVLALQKVIEKLVASICLKSGGEIPGRDRRKFKMKMIEIELKKKMHEEQRKWKEEHNSI